MALLYFITISAHAVFVKHLDILNTVEEKWEFKICFMYISDYTIWPDSLQYYRRWCGCEPVLYRWSNRKDQHCWRFVFQWGRSLHCKFQPGFWSLYSLSNKLNTQYVYHINCKYQQLQKVRLRAIKGVMGILILGVLVLHHQKRLIKSAINS